MEYNVNYIKYKGEFIMESKHTSSLKEHKFKKGVIYTPFNDALGNKLKSSSWAEDRLPEYLWMAIIHSYYGRKDGLKKISSILFKISRLNIDLITPRISDILNLDDNIQNKIYSIIIEEVEPTLLEPLTIIFRENRYKEFTNIFYNNEYDLEYKIKVLENVIKQYYFHQSNDVTDIKYLIILYMAYNGKVFIDNKLSITQEALSYYPNLEHSDEKMKLYRPTIRSIESTILMHEEMNKEFIDYFWREIGTISECKPFYIDFKLNKINYNEFIIDTSVLIEYLVESEKELALNDYRFITLIGALNYNLRIFYELIECNLNNKILGRHSCRTMIEVFIMMKYMKLEQQNKPDIWKEYQYYGISKYKMVLLKSRELNKEIKPNEESHVCMPVIESLVNEKLWEEFINIDVRYFDNKGIKQKCELVDEKELYDLQYEYDTNYVHGFWGAIRESSMLACDNAAHRFHNIPDVNFDQKLPDASGDCYTILKKMLGIIIEFYELPQWYTEKYGDEINEKTRR